MLKMEGALQYAQPNFQENVFVYCKINISKIYKLIVGLIMIRLYILVLIINYELFGFIIIVVVVI